MNEDDDFLENLNIDEEIDFNEEFTTFQIKENKYTFQKIRDICLATVSTKGFFILPSELFQNVQKKAKNNPNLNETLSKAFRDIEASAQGTASEDDFKGLFADIDVNSNKLGATVQKRNEKLVKILASINELFRN